MGTRKKTKKRGAVTISEFERGRLQGWREARHFVYTQCGADEPARDVAHHLKVEIEYMVVKP